MSVINCTTASTFRHLVTAAIAGTLALSFAPVSSAASPQEVINRALRNYRLLTNNCEHFINWCASGFARSTQLERPPGLALRVLARPDVATTFLALLGRALFVLF